MKKVINILIALVLLIAPVMLFAGCDDENVTVTNCVISQYPSKTEYFVGEYINMTGAKLKVSFSNDKTEEVNAVDYCDLTTVDMNTAGQKKIDCVYKNKDAEYRLFFYINVYERSGETNGKQVYLEMIEQMSNCNSYSFAGDVFGGNSLAVDFNKKADGVEFKVENDVATGVLIGNNMFITYPSGEKYKSSGVTYAEFTRLVKFEMGNDSAMPMDIILYSLNMAKEDEKNLEPLAGGYKLTFSHVNTGSTNGPHLPTGSYEMQLDASKRLTKVLISAGEISGSITFSYNKTISVNESEFTLVDKNFYAIKNAIIITSAKEKWDIYLRKDDGPENFYYEKVDGREYFAYKRIHYSQNYNEDCYYFYENGMVYYVDRNNSVNYKWNNVSERDFCDFMQSASKVNLISEFLSRFDVSTIEMDTLTYQECYNVDSNDSNIKYESHVYGCYAAINAGDNGQAERKYIVFEIDGGSQLRNVYIYDTKAQADEDSNVLEGGQINGWGAQKGWNDCQVSLQIGFYQNKVPTAENVLNIYGIDFGEIDFVDKTGQPLQK